MLYTLTDIEAQIAPQTFAHGLQWFTDGRVTRPNIQRAGEIVTAIIPQVGDRALRVYVRTFKDGDALTIHGECSCAKKVNCEHVVAVLLQALQDGEALPETLSRAPSAQIQGNDSALDPARPNTTPPSQVLLYLLRLDEAGLVVEPHVARRLKHGGYSLGRSFQLGGGRRRTPPRFLQAIDLELLIALDRLPRSYRDTPVLQGAESDPVLRSLLASGRLQLADDDDLLTPLRLGAARPIRLEWRCDEAAVQEIMGHTDPGCDLLLLIGTTRPTTWYLDETTGECGPVGSDLPGATADELLRLPPVAPEQTGEIRDTLARTYPNAEIPLPQLFAIETLPCSQPLPCLRLTTEEEDWDGFKEYTDFARLRFDYGGIEVDPSGPDTRMRDGCVARVRRNRKAERAAVQQLQKLGLVCNDVVDLTDDAAHFVPESDFGFSDAEAWLDFQADQLPTLRDLGWRISYQDFRFRLREATRWTCDIGRLQQDDWFSIALGVEVEGQHVDLLPILLEALHELPAKLLEQGDLPVDNLLVPFTDEQQQTQLLRMPADRLLPLLQTLLELHQSATTDDTHHLRLSRVQMAGLATLAPIDSNAQQTGLQWLGDAEARQLIERLRDLDGIPEVAPPAGLIAELRPYQCEGLNWLQFLREFRFAGILADDMGLGKTLQALAHLLLETESGRADRPSLVVAPTSLMFNWLQETRRFAPQLKVLVLQGPQRKDRFAAIAEHDLVLTTYPLLARDQQVLLARPYHLLILDEAQVIKNPKAQASQVVHRIDARHRLCLTGTPMENHLGELWALFDVLLPGLLGDKKDFRRLFRTPIEKHGNDAAAQRLRRRVRPFLLRRTKQQVVLELPDKTEIVQRIELEGKQRELYETVRLTMHRRVRDEIKRQGLARSQIVVLDALLKLRQVCCDPRLVKSEQVRALGASAKLEMLMQLLPEMVEEGRRILLFSQFTGMLDLIEQAVCQADIDFVKLTGRTRDRQTPVQRFQQGAVPLFLISLKAGGVGLNLTAADTVIHYDPWWNPAVERQATDRAHRIGQRRAVFVYKLICAGTVEEKIQAMQQRKQTLADGLYHSSGQQEPQWRSEDLDELFGPLQETVCEP